MTSCSGYPFPKIVNGQGRIADPMQETRSSFLSKVYQNASEFPKRISGSCMRLVCGAA